VRDPAVHRRFQAFWDSMINVSLDDTIWKTTEETLWRLDRAGVILPLADVAIACCARVAGAVVLTCDFHFRRIPGTRVIEELEY
jgi:predicted nucleic acid-binding protein